MAHAMETAAALSGQSKAGKYLTFALSNEEYGLEILKVREIIGYMEITAVPQTPGYVKGVINLRGQVIPVVDLRLKFGMNAAEVTEETCIIVVEITQAIASSRPASSWTASKRCLTSPARHRGPPQFGANVDTDFILGMGKVNGASRSCWISTRSSAATTCKWRKVEIRNIELNQRTTIPIRRISNV